MKVKWSEYIHVDYAGVEDYIKKDYEGKVINSNRSFWGYTYLTMACSDGEIRVCESSKTKIIPEDNNLN